MPSRLAVTTRPSGPNSDRVTSLRWPRSTAIAAWVREDQTLAVPSLLDETISSPSSETLASVTQSSCGRSSRLRSSAQKTTRVSDMVISR